MASIIVGTVTVPTAGTQVRVTTTPTPIRAVRFESTEGNTNDVYIGASDVSATNYGIRLDAAGDDSGWVKFEGRTAGDLSDFWCDVTTNGEKVQYIAILAL